ncbi:sensor histidine kinase [Nocardioides jiangxiensis]|uniref:Histidine kinase n=1 Tax=Nocardioides jiangxiensis TaxID=3064524 RepID=A0ABT9B3J4_9ACTN|nr:histidine kinase [Nocardioides sp. WY-20]MDO7869287.1 histidine kinase [Nocardioides sp. WY-20]
MSPADRRARYATVTAVARAFALVCLAPSVALGQDYAAIINVILLATLWIGCVLADGMPRVAAMPALTVEASLTAFIAVLTLEQSPVLLPALVIPPFIGGMVRGVRGTLETIGAELVITIAVVATSAEIPVTDTIGAQLFGALAAGVGLGSVTAFFHESRESRSDTSSSYRDARALLTQLHDLSGSLVAGLDPVRISHGILDTAREELPFTGAVVYVQTANGYTPLLEGDVTDAGADNGAVLDEVFRTGRPVVDGPWVAVPLVTDAGLAGAITGALLPHRLTPAQLHHTLEHLVRLLRREALQLDTALIFAALRDEATAEERRRLARDLHDGVAQDLAGLGYLIDEITDVSTEAEVVEQGRALRGELSRVVAELRRSVFLLRNEGEGKTLGQRLEALAAHIASRSGISVEVEVTEGSKRLRPEVEAELLRIAQEGMNNAARHADARRITVEVVVQAPDASVRVADDGRGLQTGRDDSHGVRIMKERARRIGAGLQLHNREDGPGAELLVALGDMTRLEGPGEREELAS